MKSENVEDAVVTLQQLGLKEYEARCFVGLIRLETGTAKTLAEITEVPRTRVYDAIRVLEAQGLVEVQHSNPKQFRAVPLDEAVDTLRDQYESRVEQLRSVLSAVEIIDEDVDAPVQQVWAMTGSDAIENRTNELIREATNEVVFVIGDERVLSDDLVAVLNDRNDEIELVIGALTPSLESEVKQVIPGATTFVSGLGWLHSENGTEDDTAIGRLLMVDRSTILVSSIVPDSGEEQAIFGEGLRNGLVVVVRRLMAQGLLPRRDPGQ